MKKGPLFRKETAAAERGSETTTHTHSRATKTKHLKPREFHSPRLALHTVKARALEDFFSIDARILNSVFFLWVESVEAIVEGVIQYGTRILT
jgi:hypothetical protein